MDVFAPDRISLQEQEVQAMLARHPLHPSVAGFHVRFDDTWDGEPGIWVFLHQPSGNERGTPETIRAMVELRKDLVGRLRVIAPDREGYVRFVLPPATPS